MHILLTGVTGFIGQELLDRLICQKHEVRVLIRPETIKRSRIAQQLCGRSGVEVIEGGLTDAKAIDHAHRKVDLVYHLAWHSRRRNSYNSLSNDADPAEINLAAGRHVVEACAKHRVRRLVCTSTVAVYGASSDVSQWPLTEETPLFRGSSGNTYVRSYVRPKVALENMVRQASHAAGFDYVILRPSIVYGVGWHGAEQLLERALSGPMRRPSFP